MMKTFNNALLKYTPYYIDKMTTISDDDDMFNLWNLSTF